MENIFGVSFGSPTEPTAVALISIERLGEWERECSEGGREYKIWESKCRYNLQLLHRFEAGKNIREVLAYLKGLGQRTEYPSFYLDIGAVGEPVLKLAMQTLDTRSVHGIYITAGAERHDPVNKLYHVAKLNLVSELNLAFTGGYLKAPGNLPLLPELVKELQAFRLEARTQVNTDSILWRESPQDDLVFGLACAVFGALQKRKPYRSSRCLLPKKEVKPWWSELMGDSTDDGEWPLFE